MMVDLDYDKACFFLKRTLVSNAAQETGKVMIDIEDDDLVRYISIREHHGHVLPFCYALKIDPALKHFCPARPAAARRSQSDK
jgi:hypothetical protein